MMLQFHRRHPLYADALGLGFMAVLLAAMIAFRVVYVEPRVWGAACVAAEQPLSCIPRGITIWLQGTYGWGAAALLAGLLTLIRVPSGMPVAAVTLGMLAIVNQNATWGVLGLLLGAWSWVRRDFRKA